jgi:hypothetical protein
VDFPADSLDSPEAASNSTTNTEDKKTENSNRIHLYLKFFTFACFTNQLNGIDGYSLHGTASFEVEFANFSHSHTPNRVPTIVCDGMPVNTTFLTFVNNSSPRFLWYYYGKASVLEFNNVVQNKNTDTSFELALFGNDPKVITNSYFVDNIGTPLFQVHHYMIFVQKCYIKHSTSLVAGTVFFQKVRGEDFQTRELVCGYRGTPTQQFTPRRGHDIYNCLPHQFNILG